MSGLTRTFDAAVVQAAPVAFDVEATLAKVARLTAESAAGGADLVVFPEAFVSWLSARDHVWSDGRLAHARGPSLVPAVWESSIDVPGPVIDRLGAVAREHGVHLVIGVMERDGGTLYCTAVFFARRAPTWGSTASCCPPPPSGSAR